MLRITTPDDVLDRMEELLKAQLFLVLAEKPLHVYEIVRQIQHHFDITVKWESVVSTLVKKAAKGEQFVRTGKNTFGIVGRDLL